MGETMKSKNYQAIVVIVVSVFILTLISCSQRRKTKQITVPPNAEAGAIALEPDVYEVNDHEYAAHTGMIVVHENRSDPDSRLIALPVIQVHATGDSVVEPVFYLSGGPGMSNMGHYNFVEDFIDNHEVVLIGYRGVDGSVILDCSEVDAFFGNLPGDLTEQVTIDSMAEAYSRCARRLQNEGVDTDGYNMTEVIQDMEDARRALGYDKINLLSSSYGTRLAMIYAWVYPKSIHRSAMISVNPPGHFVWYPDVMDEQLEYYSELCSKDQECSRRTDDLAETIRRAVRNMPDHWLIFPIKKGHVLMGTFMMLYHTDTAPGIFDAWIAAGDGDWSGLALLSLAMDFMIEGASVWGESAAKAMSADYVFDHDSDPLAEFMPENSIIGAPGSILGIAAVRGWPVKLIADSLRTVIPSDVPTLLISGNIDFSTPARFARDELLPYLKNGRQVILSEFGHTGDVWGKQREATTHMLKTFFNTGVVDDSRFSYSPMNFNVSLGYPTIMKLVVGGIIFISIILIIVILLVVRKIRRKRMLQKTAMNR
jgi:pimeloyl-ACP methyl ester carboxylesterase